jgi:hypothetical protein
MEDKALLKYIDYLETKIGRLQNPKTYGIAKEGFFEKIFGKPNPSISEVKKYEQNLQETELEHLDEVYKKTQAVDGNGLSGEIETRGLFSLFHNSKELMEACNNLESLLNKIPDIGNDYATKVKRVNALLDLSPEEFDINKLKNQLIEFRKKDKPIQIHGWKLMKVSAGEYSENFASYVDSSEIFYARTNILIKEATTIEQLGTLTTVTSVGTNMPYHSRHGKINIFSDFSKIKSKIMELLSLAKEIDKKIYDISEDIVLPEVWKTEELFNKIARRPEYKNIPEIDHVINFTYENAEFGLSHPENLYIDAVKLITEMAKCLSQLK